MRSKINLDSVSSAPVNRTIIRRLMIQTYVCRKFFFILMNQYDDTAAQNKLMTAAVNARDC